MAKASKFWVGENAVRAGQVAKERVWRKTLKDLCVSTGVNYGTAKRRQDGNGGTTTYVLKDGETWVLWKQVIGD